jgi:hypothetical protein
LPIDGLRGASVRRLWGWEGAPALLGSSTGQDGTEVAIARAGLGVGPCTGRRLFSQPQWGWPGLANAKSERKVSTI